MSIAVFTLLLSITGISFASWQIVSYQEDINEIVTGCFDVAFTSGNDINRLDGSEYPISDSQGILTAPYTFTIKNNCPPETALNVDYIVRLDIVDTSEIPLNRMKAYFTGEDLTIGPAVLDTPTTFEPTTITENGYKSTAYILTSGTLASGEEATYNIRLWIDISATLAEASGKDFSAKITVVSTAAANSNGGGGIASFYLRDRILEDNGGESAIVARGIPNYSLPAGDGLFATRAIVSGWTDTNAGLFSGTRPTHESNNTDSFYFRGSNDHVNNHVQFAGFWWRIVRIEGNGNIRLIFNNKVTTNPIPPLVEHINDVGFSEFNSFSSDNRYVGFMHGTSCTNYATCHSNEINSTMKANLDNWYSSNIINQGTKITSKIATNTIFCGDRNLAWGTGVGTTDTRYGAWSRITTPCRPSLQCINRQPSVPDTNDQFGVSGNGNGSLLHPVGLLSVDEAILGGYPCISDEPHTPFTWLANDNFWLMTPITPTQNFGVCHGNMNMRPCWSPLSTNQLIRPVISLLPDTRISSGNGTRDNPYIVL